MSKNRTCISVSVLRKEGRFRITVQKNKGRAVYTASKAYSAVFHKILTQKVLIDVQAGWADSEVNQKLSEHLGPEGGDWCHQVWLEASDQLCAPRVSTGSSPAQQLH